ncbi:MAG: efflux RND transporter periplasmic adaptor subunit, partial [Bacteroidaceae bacterium]|nr:efflux RND transporter periplasmic adaptor subunit [Bacteroidaceae bacterium]
MKTDNQTMDRAIPVSVQRKRRMVKYGKYALIVATVLGLATWLGVLMMTSVDRKSLIMSEVDQGTIDVSITATGKVVPAFEEVIISPISAQILEVYAHSGDTVDVGTPLLRLDLQSAQIDYSKALDEREIRQQQLVQLTTNTETQLSDRRMQIEVEEMKLGQLEAQLRNEQYLDSLGSGTKDRVRQAEITLRTAQMQLRQLKQQYQNEVRVRQADLRMKQLQDGIADKGLSETRRTLDGANIRSPRKATLTYICSE